MKVNLEEAKSEFIKYVNKYDKGNDTIKRKFGHSLRVMEISRILAEKLGLKEEEIEIATLIGLLHDIARFEQETRFKTLDDLKSIDHGDLGVEILQKNNFIREFISDDSYDDCILKAIKNHNKYEIEEGLSEKELVFAKIIRDSDKLDIFYEVTERFWKDKIDETENGFISEEVEILFKRFKHVKRKNAIKGPDYIIFILAFVFDIYYKASFEIIKNEKYIDKLVDQFDYKHQETKEKMKEIKELANKYLEEKIKEE